MVRLGELRAVGITAATVSRLERQGAVVRLARGLYQLPDAPLDTHHSLAEAAKLVPRGIVCLLSALAFHDLADRIPARVWLAIGPKEWRPRVEHPPLRIVRFSPAWLASGFEEHLIEDVPVRVFGAAKTIADLFRYRRTVGQAAAVAALREVLRTRKATPSDIARFAAEGGVWKVIRPYLEALTADG
jgi:predicted transcriptional regulator of viral defense system